MKALFQRSVSAIRMLLRFWLLWYLGALKCYVVPNNQKKIQLKKKVTMTIRVEIAISFLLVKKTQTYIFFTILIDCFLCVRRLDSKLLHELACEGDGLYAFIPDASFVGTTFVHATSNFLTTYVMFFWG